MNVDVNFRPVVVVAQERKKNLDHPGSRGENGAAVSHGWPLVPVWRLYLAADSASLI